MTKGKKLPFWAGICFCIAAMGWLAFKWFSPHRLVVAADDMSAAMLHGDSKTLFRYVINQEIECSGLTEEKLQRAWDILLRDRVSGSKVLRRPGGEMSSNGHQATSEIALVDRNERSWSIVMISNKSGDDAKSTVLIAMFLLGSLTEQEESMPGSRDLKLVRKYRKQLIDIGLPKVMLNPKTCITWDKLEEILVQSGSSKQSN